MEEHIYKACLNKEENNKSWAELAEEFGYDNPERLRGLFRREKERRSRVDESIEFSKEADKTSELDDGIDEKKSYTETDDNIQIVCASPRIKTREDVIREFGIDESVWKIDKFTISTSEGYRKDRKVQWEVKDGVVVNGQVDDSGKMLIVPMYHTKTTLVRKNQNDISFSDIETLFKKLSFQSPVVGKIKQREEEVGKILEVVLADIHVGSDSSIQKTKQKLDSLLSQILERIEGKSFKKILLIQSGDFFHFDNYGRTTTGGTAVTTSVNYYKMWESGVTMLVDFIQVLSSHVPLEMINIFGNHDSVSSFTAGKALEYYFKNNQNVTIDNGHDERKYRKIGRSLVGFVHGDMSKNNVYSLLQREARILFAETSFFEIHLGHLHHEHSFEKDGVIIRYLPTITETDEWHKKQGYTGNRKCAVCFVWDEWNGLEEQWWINID